MVVQNKISDQTFSGLKGVLDTRMIATATAFVALERGPDEARRLLRIIGDVQGPFASA